MGRPKKEIDMEIFEELCRIQCTQDEIASVFHCSIDTLSRFCKAHYKESFADIYKKLSKDGKSSLRRMQWELAKKSTPMAIWLGKQYLGQKDDPTVDAPPQGLPTVNIIIADCEAKDADS